MGFVQNCNPGGFRVVEEKRGYHELQYAEASDG